MPPLFTFSQDYKVGEAYVIQELIVTSDPTLLWFIRGLKMNTKGDLRIVSEKDLLEYIKKGAVDHDKLTYLLHRHMMCFILRNDQFPEYDNFRDFVRIQDILLMQDVPIYKIGDKLYLIRKLRYAYIDHVNVFSRKDELYHYIYGGNEPDTVDSTMVSAKSFFNIDYFQYFLFNMEILPNHKKLNKVFWKRRYEAVLLEPWGNRK